MRHFEDGYNDITHNGIEQNASIKAYLDFDSRSLMCIIKTLL